jgi:6-phosphogluconolactonase
MHDVTRENKIMAKEFTLVGCFTTAKRRARGTGIDLYRGDPGTDTWTLSDHVGNVVNPSYLHPDPVRNVVYVVHGDLDIASSYTLDRSTGKLHLLGQAKTGGQNGVSAVLDPSGRYLVVASLNSGTISALPVEPDGRLEDFCCCLKLSGTLGPHRTEQSQSFPHHSVFDPSGRFVLVPDRGLDEISVLALDPSNGQLTVVSHARLRAGAGPRHITFHPHLPRAFVVDEIDSMVVTCNWDAQAAILTPLHVAPGLPPTFFGHSIAAEVVVSPCGRFVYISNRGADVLTQFGFDESKDRLDVIGWMPTGRETRFMTLTPQGDSLLVANEQSDNIVICRIDSATGMLSSRAEVHTASPSTIVFL